MHPFTREKNNNKLTCTFHFIHCITKKNDLIEKKIREIKLKSIRSKIEYTFQLYFIDFFSRKKKHRINFLNFEKSSFFI